MRGHYLRQPKVAALLNMASSAVTVQLVVLGTLVANPTSEQWVGAMERLGLAISFHRARAIREEDQ